MQVFCLPEYLLYGTYESSKVLIQSPLNSERLLFITQGFVQGPKNFIEHFRDLNPKYADLLTTVSSEGEEIEDKADIVLLGYASCFNSQHLPAPAILREGHCKGVENFLWETPVEKLKGFPLDNQHQTELQQARIANWEADIYFTTGFHDGE